MTVVMYPLQAQKEHSELRYSLRSIEKHIPTPFEVVIVGDHVPGWLVNVTQIHLPDVPGRKQLSIRRKILAALEYAEEILFMNDDVYLMRPGPFPYYWFNDLKKHTSEAGAKILMKELEAMGKPTKDYDGHYALIYDQRFKEVSRLFTDDCIIKSMYCNYLGIEGVELADCKILSAMKPEVIRGMVRMKPAFSTGARSLKSVLPVLGELFPNKSKFEV